MLLEETIRTKPYPNASADTFTGSLFYADTRGNASGFTNLLFTDLQGKVLCVPPALCRSWFGLVKHIEEDCIYHNFDPVKENINYEVLEGGHSFQLVTEGVFLATNHD